MRITLVFLALTLTAACVGAPRASSSAPPAPTAGGASAGPASTRPDPGVDRPPALTLSSGGDPVEGWLGSYCWERTCADVALVPKAQLPLLEADGEQELSFAVASDEVASWIASYMEGPGDDVTELARGGDDFDPDTTQTPPAGVGGGSFEAPPPGDWIVTVMVRSVTGGDAIFAWHVMAS